MKNTRGTTPTSIQQRNLVGGINIVDGKVINYPAPSPMSVTWDFSQFGESDPDISLSDLLG